MRSWALCSPIKRFGRDRRCGPKAVLCEVFWAAPIVVRSKGVAWQQTRSFFSAFPLCLAFLTNLWLVLFFMYCLGFQHWNHFFRVGFNAPTFPFLLIWPVCQFGGWWNGQTMQFSLQPFAHYPLCHGQSQNCAHWRLSGFFCDVWPSYLVTFSWHVTH